MVIYSDMSLNCSLLLSLLALRSLPGAVIIDLIPVCGLGGSVSVQYTIGVWANLAPSDHVLS